MRDALGNLALPGRMAEGGRRAQAPLADRTGSLVTEACEMDETKFQVKRIAELKTQPQAKK